MQSAWIGTLDPVTRRLVVMASYGSGAVEPGLWLDPAHNARMQGMGSASTAIREDRQVWIQDIPNARLRWLFRCTAMQRWWVSSC